MDFGIMKVQDRKKYLEHWSNKEFQQCFDLLKKFGMLQNMCDSCTMISIVTNATQVGLANKTLVA
jgi:hypothetical protein